MFTVVDKLKRLEKSLGFKNEIIWLPSFLYLYYHLLAVYWVWSYSLPVKWITVILAFCFKIVSGAGITCGAHRLFTHKSYKVNEPLKALLIFCYCLNGHIKYPLHRWVRDHRQHHKHSDTEADPHNASRGFFFSHIGWLLTKRNEQVIKCSQQIDVSDVKNDPLVKMVEKHFSVITVILTFVLPTLFCMWVLGENWRYAVAWVCFIRYLETLHAELSINSAAHMFGYKPYNRNIVPTESSFASLVTLGEGYHNYHHTFPFDFKAGEHFDFLDLSTCFIKCWARMGWAWDLKEATPGMAQSAIKRSNNSSD